MDIHKPKAAHSWREFATEIGTIICGILIALGLEQAIEAVHRGNEVREAREALRDEVGRNMGVAAYDQRAAPCDMRYIPRYVAWAHGGRPPPPDGRRFPFLRSSAWEISKAAVALMPFKERRAFADFYATAADYNTLVDRQRSLALRAGEAYGLDTLTPENRQELLKAMTGYRGASGVVEEIDSLLLTRGAATGAKAETMGAGAEAGLKALCKMADQASPP